MYVYMLVYADLYRCVHLLVPNTNLYTCAHAGHLYMSGAKGQMLLAVGVHERVLMQACRDPFGNHFECSGFLRQSSGHVQDGCPCVVGHRNSKELAEDCGKNLILSTWAAAMEHLICCHSASRTEWTAPSSVALWIKEVLRRLG